MNLKNTAVLFSLIFTMGCEKVIVEQSDVKTESAIVADLVYTPKNHATSIIPVPSLDADGDITMSSMEVDVDIPEKYAVVFKCQHGKFIIENDQVRTKSLYEKLRIGQEVTVSYREIFEKTLDSNGKILSRRRVKYDFIDVE